MDRKNFHCLTLLVVLCLVASVFTAPAQAQEIQHIAILESPNRQENADFGYSVAIEGNLVVIGEPRYDITPNNEGRAWIYNIDTGDFTGLIAPEPQSYAEFGYSVAISGNLIVIGEPTANLDEDSDEGRAYIYNVDTEEWTTLVSDDPQDNARFGYAVAISGGLAVIGEPMANVTVGGLYQGRAWIYNVDTTVFTELASPDVQDSGYFGHSVAISGDRVFVGEPEADVAGSSSEGKVHVFDSAGNYLSTLTAPQPRGPEEYATFGNALAAHGNLIAIGEPFADDWAGRAYIFDTDGNWVATLKQPDPLRYWVSFGWSVGISEDLVVVGEPGFSPGGIDTDGRIHIYTTGGEHISTIPVPAPLNPQDYPTAFGWSVAASGNNIVVGEHAYDLISTSNEGRAHIYKYTPTEPVGGEIAPLTTMALLPWIALVGAALALGYTITRRRPILH